MCGIAGRIATKDRADRARMERTLEVMRHRGPDGQHLFGRSGPGFDALFGHCRLKIIDLSDQADQPFVFEHLTLSFNGEIYNYLELRDELVARGYSFDTASDTEVLIKAFHCWGRAMIERLDGMYAIAILDSRTGALTLIRDPFGEKQLLFATDSRGTAFASTLDALRELVEPGGLEPDPAAMVTFLAFGFMPAPLTIFPGCRRLQAGECIEVGLDGAVTSTVRNGWTHGRAAASGHAFDIGCFESLFVGSLERRLRSDVPVALLLSGGIDSAYVAAVGRRVLGVPLSAVTIRDNLESDDEINRARRVCRILDIDHQVVEMRQRSLNEYVRDYVPRMDEPVGDPAFPILCELYQSVPREFTVFLTGDGADELFLSYSSYRRILAPAGRLSRLVPSIGPHLPGMVASLPVIARKVLMRALLATEADPGRRLAILHEMSAGALGTTLPPRLASRIAAGGIEALYAYSFEFELPDYLLLKADRASMMFSREGRTPYLEQNLLSYVAGCSPASLGLGTKSHLVKRLAHHLGEDLGFAKRGLFASGQDTVVSIGASHHPALRHPMLAPIMRRIDDPRLTDRLTYYRLVVLDSWLKEKC